MSAAETSLGAAVAAAMKERPWRRAALWLCLLAPFFYLTYGSANWLASHRSDVGAVVFDWEHAIPFIGWTIVPYWSINLFYGLSLFVCATADELDNHARRLLTAQVIAVTCFILFPLQFTFIQPDTHGLPGFLFAALTSFDKPFNQAPSLHIALLIVLWALYTRHVPHWTLWLLHPWFALVGISVLTTYQHHFIDVPTGALLGLICLWLWPDHERSPLAVASLTADRRRRQLAIRYLAGGGVLTAFGSWTGGAALWLLWPALSLALVAANYAFFGAAGFQKDGNGRMSLAARALLAPYLLGAWINSRAWTRREAMPVMVADGVALGRMPARTDTAAFSTVIDLSAELPATKVRARWLAFPFLDLVAPPPQLLRQVTAAIEHARQAGPVLVCCALGYSRSASAVAAWLLMTGRATSAAEAIKQVRRVRPSIVLDESARGAIQIAAKPNS